MKTNLIYIFVFVMCLPGLRVSGQFRQDVIATSGDFFSTSTVSLSWTSGEVITETFNGSSSILTQGFQQPSRKVRVTGKLTYNNTVNSPLNNTKVFLKTLAGLKVDSAVTNSSGDFYMYNASPGTYVFDAKITITPGGFNSVDALQNMRHFVGLITLTGMFFKAGDVNVTGNINAADALLIAKRFVSLIPTFIAGDWMITKDTITLGSTGPVNHDLKALCYGDNNASYVPLLKSSKNIELVTEGEIRGQPGKEIILPVVATEKISLGAISLVIDLKDPSVNVKKVAMPSEEGALVYNVTGTQLRISWYSSKAMIIEKNAPVILLTLISDRVMEETQPAILFRITDESEIADPVGKRYPEVRWSMPSIRFDEAAANHLFAGILPNPFSTSTSFIYALPENAEVGFTVLNALGEIVMVIPVGQQPEGMNVYTFDGSKQSQGVYLVRFEMNGKFGKKCENKRMVITR